MARWYDNDGSPRNYEGKDGASTTLREARKLDLMPSVTSILGLLDKPALTQWIARECVKESIEREPQLWFLHDGETGAYLKTKIKYVSPESGRDEVCDYDDFVSLVIKAQRESVHAKADEGGDIHGYLERWPIDGETGKDTDVICRQVYDLIESETGLGPRRWSTETRFADTANWFAGMCDLHCADDPWVIDFKTKDSSEDVQKAYGGWHKEQLHAYAHGLGIPGAQLAVVFVSRDPSDWGKPEAVKFSPVQNDPLVLHGFLLLCQRWQVEKKHGPYYEKWAEHYKALENEDVAA